MAYHKAWITSDDEAKYISDKTGVPFYIVYTILTGLEVCEYLDSRREEMPYLNPELAEMFKNSSDNWTQMEENYMQFISDKTGIDFSIVEIVLNTAIQSRQEDIAYTQAFYIGQTVWSIHQQKHKNTWCIDNRVYTLKDVCGTEPHLRCLLMSADMDGVSTRITEKSIENIFPSIEEAQVACWINNENY